MKLTTCAPIQQNAVLLLAIASAALSLGGAAALAAQQSDVASFYQKLPLAFEVNVGQTDPSVQYLSRGPGYNLYLRKGEAILSLRRDPPESAERMAYPDSSKPKPSAAVADIRLRLAGKTSANPDVQATGKLPGRVNYFRGSDASKWRTNISTFAQVHQNDVYPGIDLIYYGRQGQLEFDFIAAPGADPSAIRLQISGARGSLSKTGSLLLTTGSGYDTIELQSPVVYQQRADATRRPVAGQFRLLAPNEIGFTVGEYDRSLPLVIDPVLIYATYLGGSLQPVGSGTRDNYITGVAVNAAGEAHVTGYTFASNFPTTPGAFQATEPQCNPADCGGPLAGPDAFVTRFSADGSHLIYSTYLGGNSQDVGRGIALDSSGNAYVTGYTYSNDFPLVNPIQQYCSPVGVFSFATNTFTSLTSGCEGHPPGESTVYSLNTPDVFISELSTSGALTFSTFFGGSGNDNPVGIGLDAQGNIYIGGSTSSVYTPNNAGNSNSNIYPPGQAVPFPTTSAYQTAVLAGNNGSFFVGFVSKFSASTHQLLYSTIIGPAVPQTYAQSFSVSPSGRAVLGGQTNAVTFPTQNAAQATCPPYFGSTSQCNTSGFLAVFDTTQSGSASLVYSTFLNGTLPDGAQTQVTGVYIDAQNNVYATGPTKANNLPATSGAYATTCVGGGSGFCNGVFVTKLAPAGTIYWLTYFGCPVNYGVQSLAITADASSNVYFAGLTICQLPPVNAFQSNFTGGQPAYVAALNSTGTALLFDSYFGGTGNDTPTSLALDQYSYLYLAGYSTSTDLPVTSGAFQTTAPAPGFQNGFLAKISPVPANVCPFTLSNTSINAVSNGGSLSFTIQGGTGCLFTATSNSGFLTITGGASGSATGTVNVSVAANTGSTSRTGTLTVGGQTVTVTQAGSTQPPTTTLTISSPVALFNASSSFALNPSSLSTPQTRSITLNYTVNGASTATAYTSSVTGSPSFVSVSPTSGTTPSAMTITANVAGFSPGTYTNTVQFAGGGLTLSYPVTVIVENPSVSSTGAASYGKAGIFRQTPPSGQGALFLLDRNADGVCCAGDLVGSIGQPGDIPLAGSWSGNGVKSFGLYRPTAGLFLLDVNNNGAFDSGVDKALTLLPESGDVPVVGDWTGTGVDRVGVFRASTGTWYLDTNGDGSFVGRAFLGQSGDIPLVGNWNGVGTTSKVGIYRPASVNGQPGNFFLVDSNGDGRYTSADSPLFFLGQSGDIPLVGDWNGDGRTKVGIYRPAGGAGAGLLILDQNGNFAYDGVPTDRVLYFAPYLSGTGTSTTAQVGDLPVTGNWPLSYAPLLAAGLPVNTTRTGIYRPSTGTFFFDTSGDGTYQGRAFLGQTGDVPVGVPVLLNNALIGVNLLGNF